MEVDWRGFALPRPQERYGAIAASVIVGALWCAWHLPMFVVSSISITVLVGLLLFFVAGSLFFTWIFNRTRGSLLLMLLAHAGAHHNNPNKALPGSVTPVVVHTVTYCAVALALVLVDRKAWQPPYPPRA